MPKPKYDAKNHSLVLFDRGDEIVVQAGPEGIRFLLVSRQAARGAGGLVWPHRDEHAGRARSGHARTANRQIHQAPVTRCTNNIEQEESAHQPAARFSNSDLVCRVIWQEHRRGAAQFRLRLFSFGAPGRAHSLGGVSPLHTRQGEVLAEQQGCPSRGGIRRKLEAKRCSDE